MLFQQNKLFTSIEEAESDPYAVRRLQLWHQDLRHYAGRFSQFVNLHSLDIRWASSTGLPDDIASLGKLRIFHVLNVPLPTWPHWLCSMTELRELVVRGTEIQCIPPEICRLLNLRRLDISNANIESLPAELARLSKLRDLSASANLLTSIPADLENLRSLKSLNLVLNMFASAEHERLLAKNGGSSVFRKRRIVL